MLISKLLFELYVVEGGCSYIYSWTINIETIPLISTAARIL